MALVTMDAHGNSLHANVEERNRSGARNRGHLPTGTRQKPLFQALPKGLIYGRPEPFFTRGKSPSGVANRSVAPNQAGLPGVGELL